MLRVAFVFECCQGILFHDWKVAKPVDFHRFHEKFSKQTPTHSPRDCKCPGDESMRKATQTPKKKPYTRHHSPSRSASSSTSFGGVSVEALDDAILSGRACGFLSLLRQHRKSIGQIPNKNHLACAVCGVDTCQQCNVCERPMHVRNEPEGVDCAELPCFCIFHDT